ncbi:MAG TPA: FHA domain-containing protein [Kofleriaceae bacterium]
MTYRDAFETCPRCGVTLVDARSARSCPQCRGLWVEEPVVAEMVLAMLPPQPLSRLELAVLAPTGDPAACPTCKEPMHATTIHNVLLDRCAKHGVWFDGEELQEALRRVADPDRTPPFAPAAATPPPVPPPRLAVGKLRFMVHTPGDPIRTEVVTRHVVRIGRIQAAELRLSDPRVTRVHAIIGAVPGQPVTLIDLGSEHGTVVNGQRIEKVVLASGDQIEVGATTIVVRW